MPDVTEVIQQISYEVNTKGLENASVAIQHQISELAKMSKALEGYSKQLTGLTNSESRQINELSNKIKEADGKIKSVMGRSKSFTDEEKKAVKTQIDNYTTLTKTAKATYDEILKSQIAAADRDIEVRKLRVEKAKELAKHGNAEALKIEEDGLRRSLEQRERFAERQQAVNAAITVSNAIAAVARAALEGGGLGSIATIAALVAALAAGYAAVQSLTSENTAFADGVVGFKGKGGPRDDKNWVRISNGESVITAEGTRKNRDILEAINNGVTVQAVNPVLPLSVPVFKQPDVHNGNKQSDRKDIQKLERKLDMVVEAIEDNKLKQNIFFNEQGVGIMTEKAAQRSRKRWK